MAVASEYSGWVRELDKFQASDGGGHVDGEDDDPRYESSHAGMGGSSGQTSRTALSIATSRKAKERALSQTDELQQEMKLLNWHKLANEAALKAAIIKTNKIKREDSHLSKAMVHEDMEDKQLRIQQIIEEEQLRPLQVNSEFFRDFESKELRDETKLENDVQRHVLHLKKLKDTMAQREYLQRRRQKYREGMVELQRGNSRSNSVPKHHKSNQDEDVQDQQQSKRHQRSNSMYSNRNDGGNKHAEVICSLDKLMELEKRIRHLEDAGLGTDALDDDPRAEHDSKDVGENNGIRSKSGIHFSKRRSADGPHEPSKTVYAVKSNGTSKANKMRARVVPRSMPTAAGVPKQRAASSRPQETFLTSLPESKQRQLRRMGERERRQFLKNEKAGEEREKSRKQDVVIDGWLDKKRQAATNRKATSNQVRGGRTAANAGAPTNSAAASTGRRLAGKALPPAPKVRAPAVGAASGKRISNPHSQKFDDIRKGFEKRNESLKRAPTNLKTANAFLDARNSVANPQKSSAAKWGSTLNASAPQRSGASKANPSTPSTRSSGSNSTLGSSGKGLTPMAPNKKGSSSSSHNPTQKLPAISRTSGTSASGGKNTLQFGISNMNPSTSLSNRSVHPVAHSSQRMGGNTANGGSLPRLANQPHGVPAPSPPPLSLKNSSMPQFSRLHKR